jgi:sarcosine oxidase subunit delta
MSFMLPCPSCGLRSVYEFRFGGEEILPTRDNGSAYERANIAGLQKEWWYHRDGCGEWLVAVRNTVTNQVITASDGHE